MSGLTVSRMDFGNFMRVVREEARQTVLAAAHGLEVSRQVILRMEDGCPTKLTGPLIKLLLDQYGAAPAVREEALRLWKEVAEQDKIAKAQGNSKGFWQAYADQVLPTFPRFLRLEGAAARMVAYQPVIIPGLLQIPEYRRAVVLIDDPELSESNVERLLELTARRQARLDEADFRLEALVSEAVLHHRPVDQAVMAVQLRWLAEVGERDNVSVRIVPFCAGPHTGLTTHTFVFLEFPKGESGRTLPPIVFVEGALGSLYHEHKEQIDHYRAAISAMEAVALTEEATRDMVLGRAKEYEA